MNVLLVLTLLFSDGRIEPRTIGTMTDMMTCQFAGAAMAQAIMQVEPMIGVQVSCSESAPA